MPKAINDKPIVIMGTGIPAVCAIINRLVDIAYNAPDSGPAVNVFVVDTLDQPKPDEGTLYPLNGISTDAMHPFKTAKQPPGFPTFGEYAREIATEDPGWKGAARAPTFKHVNEYLEYMLELALTAVGDKAYVDASNKPVTSIEEPVKNGAATIHFEDGTSLDAKQIVRPGRPPHMSGPDSTLASFFPRVDRRVAIPQIVDLIWPPADEVEQDMQRMIAAHAGDNNRIRAFWELWPFRMAAFRHELSRTFGARRAERDAIEAEVVRLVGERVKALRFPGDDPGGWYRGRLELYLKVIGNVRPEDDEMGDGVEFAAALEFARVMGGDEKFIVPIAEKYFWNRCHYIGRLCGGMALDADA
jgi:hypothetical protein